MAEHYKNLGQIAPVANTLLNAYTVPAGRMTILSSLMVANTSNSTVPRFDKIRVSHAINGAADALPQYLYYDVYVPPLQTFAATLGVTMQPGDVIRVQSLAGISSFNLYGTEIY